MKFSRRKLINTAPFALLTACANVPWQASHRRVSQMRKDPIYENSLANSNLVRDFRLEGKAIVSFPNNRMRLQNAEDPSLGQASNFVFWCDKKFPKNIEIVWEFLPIKEPGLCVAFFNADGQGGKDLFYPSLKPRTGEYDQYTNSDINALQVSYFRRRWPDERAFHLCNLRQAPGFKLLATAADPIPNVEDVKAPFLIKIQRFENFVSFSINDLPLISYSLSIEANIMDGGYFGFRQMAPLIGEYANMKVFALR